MKYRAPEEIPEETGTFEGIIKKKQNNSWEKHQEFLLELFQVSSGNFYFLLEILKEYPDKLR